ncbi:DUF916 and DUF3324 domain-containing protein [Enterococcus hirae]|nr:DUF916 and DUF3324 domain-containing protein [Enterococcus hirae]
MKRKIFLLGIAALFLFLWPQSVFSAEGTFTVKTIIPANQLDKEKTYFDLRIAPGEEQDLELVIKNNSPEKKTVAASAHSATTNDNGVVEYGEAEKQADRSLRYKMSELLQLEEKVVIEAHAEKTVKAHLKVPAGAFDGILLGGLTFSEEMAGSEESAMIDNQYAYCIGVVLSENDKVIEPDLKLANVHAGQENYRNVIQANLQNDQPAMIKKLAVKGAVYQKGHDEALYSADNQELKMAPNSNFNFNIPLNGEQLAAGSYIFKGKAEADGRTWNFEKAFEITSQEAKKWNAQAVEIKNSDKSFLEHLLIIGAAVLVTILLFFLLLKKLLSRNVPKDS